MVTTTTWQIVPQIKKMRGEEIEVLIKTLNYYPSEDKDGGKVKFLRLKFPIVQVCINLAGSTTDPIRLRRCNGCYSVCWPDYERPKLIEVSKGRKALDRLEPGTVRVRGDREEFPSLATMTTYVAKRFGEQVANDARALFIEGGDE